MSYHVVRTVEVNSVVRLSSNVSRILVLRLEQMHTIMAGNDRVVDPVFSIPMRNCFTSYRYFCVYRVKASQQLLCSKSSQKHLKTSNSEPTW